MKDRSSNMNIAVILYHSEFLPPFYFLQSKKVGSDTSNAYLPEFCPAERLPPRNIKSAIYIISAIFFEIEILTNWQIFAPFFSDTVPFVLRVIYSCPLCRTMYETAKKENTTRHWTAQKLVGVDFGFCASEAWLDTNRRVRHDWYE